MIENNELVELGELAETIEAMAQKFGRDPRAILDEMRERFEPKQAYEPIC